MDARVALDWLEGCCESPADTQAATPKKRQLPSQAGSASKRASRGSSAASSTLEVAPSEGGDSRGNARGDDVPKQCVGCRRIQGEPSSLVGHQEVLEWAYGDGRGAWCAACMNVFRTFFSGHAGGLTRFGQNLQTDESLRDEWRTVLLANIMLRKEGNDRISREMLATRCDGIKGLLTTMSLPLPPSILVPVAQLSTEERLQFRGAPLLNMQLSPGQYTVGVAIPRGARPSLAPSLVLRVGGDSDCVLHDYRLFAERVPAEVMPGERWEVGSGNSAEKEKAIASNGLAAKAQHAISLVKSVMQNFTADAWISTAREAAFTQPLTKLAVLGKECEVNCSPALARNLEAWQDFAGQAKRFMKEHREFRKKFAEERLVQLHGPMSAFQAHWNELMEAPLAGSWQALALQVGFAKSTAVGGVAAIPRALEATLAATRKAALFPHRLGGPAEEEVSFEAWLRNLLFKNLKACMNKLSIDKVQESAGALVDCLREVEILLSRDGAPVHWASQSGLQPTLA